MNTLRVCLLTTLCAIFSSTTLLAGEVRFEGAAGYFNSCSLLGECTIEIRFDLNALDSLQNGGAVLDVHFLNPSVARFTSAEVIIGGRWSFATNTVSDSSVQLTAASIFIPGNPVSGPGLPAGAQDILFATINYEMIDLGLSDLVFDLQPEMLVDGRDFGIDVTPNYSFPPSFVHFMPEPGSLVLAGIGLVGLAVRRRNGKTLRRVV